MNGAGCTATHLGYDLSSALFTSVSEVAGVDLTGIDNSVIKGLTYALVLVPIGGYGKTWVREWVRKTHELITPGSEQRLVSLARHASWLL